MDRRRRLVDLDDRRAGVGEAPELGLQDRHERLGRGDARRVDLAGTGPQPARQRVRPGQRHLERPRRSAPRRSGTPRRRRGRRVPRSARAPRSGAAGRDRRRRAAVGRERPDAGQVAVELGREEAGPAHLAVGDHVDPGLLLVADREVDARRRASRRDRPARTRRAGRAAIPATNQPDGRATRRRWSGAPRGSSRSTSAKANARAGLSTNSAVPDVGVEPRAVHRASLNRVEQVGRGPARHRRRGSSPAARRPCRASI